MCTAKHRRLVKTTTQTTPNQHRQPTPFLQGNKLKTHHQKKKYLAEQLKTTQNDPKRQYKVLQADSEPQPSYATTTKHTQATHRKCLQRFLHHSRQQDQQTHPLVPARKSNLEMLLSTSVH